MTSTKSYKYKIALISLIILALLICASSLLLSQEVGVAQADAIPSVPNSLYYGRNWLQTNRDTRLVNAYDTVVTGIGNKNTEINLQSYNLSMDELKLVMQFHRFDHVEHYWLPNTYAYSTSAGKVLSVKFQGEGAYLTGFNDTLFEQGAAQYLALVDGVTSDYEKALILHDALVRNVTYVTTATNAHNCYGAFVDGEAVCEGYAEAYQYLLLRCGIQCHLVTGTSVKPGNSSSEGHEWNLVRLNNKYYYTDVTWDDPTGGDDSIKPIYHAYFNINESILLEDHAIDEKQINTMPQCNDLDLLYTGMVQSNPYNVNTAAAGMTRVGNVGTIELFFMGSRNNDNFSSWFNSNFNSLVSKTYFNNRPFGTSVDGSATSVGREHILVITGPIQHATALNLNKSALTLKAGLSETLTANMSPASYCTDIVEWTSSNPAVATVDQSGKVTAIAPGSATISAKANNITKNCALTVTQPCTHTSKVNHSATQSTCTVQGYDEYYDCPECGKYFNASMQEIPAIPYRALSNHTGGTATCTQKKVCTVCSNEYGEVDSNNHVGFTSTYIADNSDDNKHYHVCTGCGAKDDGEAHTGGTATCADKKVCTICNAQYGALDMNNHVGFSTTYVAENSDNDKHYHVCSGCGAKDEGETHTGGTATCIAKKVCSTCNAQYGDVDENNHVSLSTTYDSLTADASKHYHFCDACNKKDAGEEHVWNFDEATEEHDKHCTICEYVAQTMLGHTHHGVLHNGFFETCTVNGEKDYYTCTCGQFFSDEECENIIDNLNEWKIIPATHIFATDVECVWSEDMKSAVLTLSCSRCSHTQDVNVDVTYSIKEISTLFRKGKGEYLAEVEINGVKYSATKEKKINSTMDDARIALAPISEKLSFGGKVDGFALFLSIIGVGILLILVLFITLIAVAKSKKKRDKNKTDHFYY